MTFELATPASRHPLERYCVYGRDGWQASLERYLVYMGVMVVRQAALAWPPHTMMPTIIDLGCRSMVVLAVVHGDQVDLLALPTAQWSRLPSLTTTGVAERKKYQGGLRLHRELDFSGSFPAAITIERETGVCGAACGETGVRIAHQRPHFRPVLPVYSGPL